MLNKTLKLENPRLSGDVSVNGKIKNTSVVDADHYERGRGIALGGWSFNVKFNQTDGSFDQFGTSTSGSGSFPGNTHMDPGTNSNSGASATYVAGNKRATYRGDQDIILHSRVKLDNTTSRNDQYGAIGLSRKSGMGSKSQFKGSNGHVSIGYTNGGIGIFTSDDSGNFAEVNDSSLPQNRELAFHVDRSTGEITGWVGRGNKPIDLDFNSYDIRMSGSKSVLPPRLAYPFMAAFNGSSGNREPRMEYGKIRAVFSDN